MSQPGAAVPTAMLCAGTVTAQFIAGKATRDALYLASLDVTSLPVMVMVTAALSIGLVMLSARCLRRVSPVVFVSASFLGFGLLLLLQWWLVGVAPRAAAVLVYLLISGAGPMLGSGFWLIATESFDPHTAKKRFGQIAGIGTLGGLAGGLLAERVAAVFGVATMLPLLAAMNIVCAWQIRRLGRVASQPALDQVPELAPDSPRSGFRVLSEAPYLRNLAWLVLLGTVAAALVDYVFKAQAVSTFGRGDALLRFFAVYYAAVSMLTFVLQTSASRLALERIGLSMSAGTPSLALLAGSLGNLLAPGFEGAAVARGGESVLRGSLYRAGYELFYTPIPSAEKRAAKSLIDVGADRAGDALGGGMIQAVLWVAPAAPVTPLLALTVACSLAALLVASRLNRGYVETLERSLVRRAVELDLEEVDDLTTRTVMLRTLQGTTRPTQQGAVPHSTTVVPIPAGVDPEIHEILALRSRDRDRVVAVLRHDQALPATLVAHVIPLLAWDLVSEEAIRALRKVADTRVGELVDALLDATQPFAIRRRLARVLSVSQSQRAVDGLLLGLDDQRFEVRFQCARALAVIKERTPAVRVDEERIYAVVLREVAVGRSIWESHRVLDPVDEGDGSAASHFVSTRSHGLAHVFTLLSLILPADAVQAAFRGLQTDDHKLRGTALEYLDGVLPPAIRARLWPSLEELQGVPRRAAQAESWQTT